MSDIRLPPYSIESESSVLGGLLLSNDAWDRVADLLLDEDFYRHEHRLIYAAIGSLINASKPADVITVYEKLKAEGKDDDAGGLAYIDSLAQYVPSAKNIRRYAEVVREQSILRKLASAGDEIAASALARNGVPVMQLIDEAQAKVLALGESKSDNTHSLESLVVNVIETVEERSKNPSSIFGTPSGFIDLDRMTSGMQAGDLIVLAARPSMGKTSLAMNIAENVALKERLPVAVFSLEMSAAQLAMRVAASVSRINQTNLRSGKLRDDEWPRLVEGIEKMRGGAMEIDETASISIGRLRTSARRAARKLGGKLGLIVVDYIQLMSTSSKEENRATALGEISAGLKAVAKEMGCPVIALSQLNRGVEARTDKRPLMSDIRESGAIEQDADIIAFIYRDDYYNPDSKEPGIAELIIAKHRSGPTGTIRLAFIKELTRFESLAHG